MSLDQPHVTTTHTAPEGAPDGLPRLVLKSEALWQGEQQPVFALTRTITTIGSDPSCDVVLAGLEPLHAVVRQDGADEFVLDSCGPEVRLHGAVVEESALLRTGARVDIGTHALAFSREEHADHGRPYGGREGGEIGHQRSQPPRRTA